MEYQEINKTVFKNEYNIDKVLVRKSDIMEFIKTYKENNNVAVAFAHKKQHRVTLEDIMNEVKQHKVTLEYIMNEVKQHRVALEYIMNEIVGIKSRLDNIVKKNNLIE